MANGTSPDNRAGYLKIAHLTT